MPDTEVHVLKTDPNPFNGVWVGNKLFELRKFDRPFKIGDTLSLHETTATAEEMKAGSPLEYTGRCIQAKISYMLVGPAYGLAEGYAILGFNEIKKMTEGSHVYEGLKLGSVSWVWTK